MPTLGAHTVSKVLSDRTLNRIMAIESAGKPRAKAKTSSASGLFQFIDDTWLKCVKKYRPDRFINKQQCLKLRFNPSFCIEIGARFTEANAAGLGRGFTDGDLYLAHFLGLGTARKVMRASPDTLARAVCDPRQAKANPTIIKATTTCRQLRAWAENCMETRWAKLGEVDWVKKYYQPDEHSDDFEPPVKHEENFDHLDNDEDTPTKVDTDTETEDTPDADTTVDDTIQDAKDTAKETVVSRVKTLIKSKIAWLSGLLGGTGAASTVTTDPETQSLLVQLLHKPAFWIMVASIIIAGVIIYFRWRDHGPGKKS